MIFQRINRTDAEKMFVIVKNGYSTAPITVGQAVMWGLTAADGLTVTRPTARATNAGTAVAGAVSSASIAFGSYGLVQVYGYHSALRARTVTGGTPAIAAGRPMCLNVAGSVFCFESIATGSAVILRFPCGFFYGATSVFTTATVAGFLKCL